MKSLMIYGPIGILAILFIMMVSVERQERLEHTIEYTDLQLEERKEEVWALEKIVREQNDALFMKDRVIDKQQSHASYYMKTTESKKKEYAEQKKALSDAKKKLAEAEARLKEAETKAKARSTEKKSKKQEEAEKPSEKEEEDPVIEPEIEPIEEPKEKPKSNEPPPATEEKPVEPPKEDPKEEPITEPDPEPEPDEPVIEEPPKEDPITVPPPDPTPDPKDEAMTMEATAYIAMCDTGCTGKTATGYDVRETIYFEGKRIIAVDPSVIPLKTTVRVETQDGTIFNAIALDTGGAIKGNKVDLLVQTTAEALAFGRQSLKVTILE